MEKYVIELPDEGRIVPDMTRLNIGTRREMYFLMETYLT